ncbi:hypothetical protein SUGI_0147910 [Cryptomeria japonica]|uniref:phytosulfokine receptor 2 n=1 Tax=Cryptomeria japonica TaxID=3369 RepID=UPI002408B6B3|nr:phytosulfokine receptor 2 [Cryptomeria japonica]GLJ11232.1 hypothetical protein SUGI_0147910 [Cryptomeria japonica]
MLLPVSPNWKLKSSNPRALLWLVWWCALLSLSYQQEGNIKSGLQSDMEALMNLSNHIVVSSKLNWNPNINCCVWEGVGCKDDRVTRLWLPGRGLKGSLTSSLGSLDQLKELNFSSNMLDGVIPDELFSLQTLQVLDLSFNNLSGPLPAPKGLGLIQSFNVSSNFFANKLPQFGPAPYLIAFNVSNNSFSGPIPIEICNYSNSIRILDFSLNGFEGHLDKGLGECTAIEELYLGFNSLFGFLPDDLYTMISLRKLSAPSNRFAGSLISDIEYLTNLTVLSLYCNNFTGNLPKELGRLENLEQLILYSNHLGGLLPFSLSSCKKLQVLNLRNNSLQGDITLNFTSFPELISLDLSSNQFSGQVPPTLSSCTKMKSLSLAKNQLQGQIPNSMASLVSLHIFSISNNTLTNITRALQVFQDLKNLSTLILTKNFLGESIPQDVKGFKQLQILALGNCALSGQIPTWLQNCSNLQVLDLSWNRLNGNIPPWIGNFQYLFYLDIANNSLSGVIPKEFTNLRSLISPQNTTHLDESSFDFPLFVKHYQNASGLQYNYLSNFPPSLYLSNNKLSGTIWPDFGNLKLLHIFELRSNNLTGTIPDQLSSMTNLEALDLSENSLTGRIPTSLQELTFLARFNVANNHLEGVIPSGRQFTTFPKSSFEGNLGLCGLPLTPCGSTAGKPVNGEAPLNRGKRLSRSTILGIAVSVGVGIAILLTALLWGLSRREIETQTEEGERDCDISQRMSDVLASSLVIMFHNQDITTSLTVADLLKATNNFDQANIIGCGGFGLVYKATLADGTKVAIKRLSGDCGQMEREFKAEVEALSRAQHKNLVSLQGYCRYGNYRLLIYSYMENGSLDYWLHEKQDGGSVLDWPTRLKIAQGASRGLAYMHRICEPHIVHRDIKSSNILLDAQFEAYVADFGLSRLILPYDTHVTTELVGTLGYIPPEYGQAWVATLRGDMYSFGVVILELLTKRRPVEVCKAKKSTDLVAWVQEMRSEGKQEEVFDPLLRDKGFEDQMLQVLDVACMCTNQNPFKRPTIQEVVSWLENVGLDAQQVK